MKCSSMTATVMLSVSRSDYGAGTISHFVRHLIDGGYIYSYRSGANYYKPVGIEFMTAVLPENAEKVLKIWGDFRENAERLLSREHMEMTLDKFLKMLSLEWLQVEKKIKWIAESFTLYRTIIDPDIVKRVVVESDTLKRLPGLIKRSSVYASLVGPLENFHEL